jgi:hypothetical protein
MKVRTKPEGERLRLAGLTLGSIVLRKNWGVTVGWLPIFLGVLFSPGCFFAPTGFTHFPLGNPRLTRLRKKMNR